MALNRRRLHCSAMQRYRYAGGWASTTLWTSGMPRCGRYRWRRGDRLLATSAVNASIPNGLLYGGSIDLLAIQLLAVGVVWAFVFAATYAIMWAITKAMPDWKMTREEERIGPDIVQHGESAYS